MRFHKLISVILHPIVIPTIGILLFLALTPDFIQKERQYLLLSIVFFSTYIVPIIFLIILKALGVINSFHVKSIKERKVPIFLMLIIFYVLGKLLVNISVFKEIGVLFFGTNLSLIIIYLLFFFNIKTSLHVVSMSNTLGFFLVYGTVNSIPILPISIILLILTGLLASSRLCLKAHKPLEIYLAFFLGLVSQFAAYHFL